MAQAVISVLEDGTTADLGRLICLASPCPRPPVRISVVVPAHNEEENLRSLVPRLIDVLQREYSQDDYEVIIVDDNSTDSTSEVVSAFASSDRAIHLVRRTDEPGFGEAVKAGLLSAHGDIVIPFMADHSDDAEDIPRLVDAIERGHDVAYGSRFLPGSSVESYPSLKLLYNRSYNTLLRLAFSLPRQDTTNAFKAYRREVLETVGVGNLRSRDFDLTAELPVKAHLAGFSSIEVPVSWRDRTAGVSKLQATRKGAVYGWRLLQLFLSGALTGYRSLAPGKGATRASRFWVLFMGLIGVIAVMAILALGEYSAVLERVASASLPLLLIASSLYLLAFFFRTWRWRVLLNVSGHPTPRAPILSSVFLGWMTNLATPGRFGELLSCVALRSTDRVPFGASLGTLLFSRLLDLGILSLLLILGLGLSPELGLLTSLLLVAVGLTALVGTGLFFLMRYGERLALRLGVRISASKVVLEGVASALRSLVGKPRIVATSILLSLPIWALEVGTFMFVAWSLGLSVPVTRLTVTAAAAFSSQALPLTPGGIGTYEGVVTGVLLFFGTPIQLGLSLALLDHLLRGLVVVVSGLLALGYTVMRARDRHIERLALERRAARTTVPSVESDGDPSET